MNPGKGLMLLGGCLFLAGLIWAYCPGLLTWFGRLPGDMRWEGKSGYVFIPITSMLLTSLLLTLIFNLFFRK